MLKHLLSAFLCAVLGAVLPSQSQPGDTTTITVQYIDGVDQKINVEGDAPRTGKVELTVAGPGGNVDITVNWSCKDKEHTRESLAQKIADDLKAALRAHDLPDTLVTTKGCAVFVKKTPPGVGKNTGTLLNPVSSPSPAEKDVHTRTITSNKDGK